MEFGKCKLCLLDKPLCESHLIPESLYAHVREGGESPIRVGDGVVMPTDRHMTTYLLCSKCEDILSKGGETWVAPKLAWVDGRFPLFDLLEAAGGFSAAEEGEGLFYARDSVGNPAGCSPVGVVRQSRYGTASPRCDHPQSRGVY